LGGLVDIANKMAFVHWDESLVLKQDQATTLHIVSNTYRKHNPTKCIANFSYLQLPWTHRWLFWWTNRYNNQNSFIVNGCKPSFEARPRGSISTCLQYIQKEESKKCIPNGPIGSNQNSYSQWMKAFFQSKTKLKHFPWSPINIESITQLY
jgi:hypothetical protein